MSAVFKEWNSLKQSPLTLSLVDVGFQRLICVVKLTQPQDLWSRLQIEQTTDFSVSARHSVDKKIFLFHSL